MIARSFICSLLALVSCTAADLFPVTGTITNAITRSPVPHAQVYLYRSTGPRPNTPYITGTDGRFSFNLPAGTYALHAGIRGTSENSGSNNDESGLGSAVIVGPGKDTTNLIFRFFPTASISGKVLDDSGEPVENATVQLIRTSVVTGVRVTRAFRSVRTNDLGEYRLGWIPAADGYYVTVTGEPWYSKRDLLPGMTSVENMQAYAPTYYPNTSEPAHAAPIKIAPGEEVHADFTLRTVLGAKVLVTHGAARFSKGLVSLTYTGIAGIEAFQQQENLNSGERLNIPQTLSGVPPGSYTLRVTAAAGSSDLIGIQRIDVNGSDITVDVPLHPAASVTGTLKFQNPGTRPTGSLIVVLAREGSGATYSATVKSDGTFRINNVLPAKYRASIHSDGGYFPEKIEATGSPLRDRVLDIGDGDTVSLAITASDETGSINGYVKSGDKAIAGVLAVLAPVPSIPLRYHAFQTESDGSFDIHNVPAGNYMLFAIENTLFEYNNPEAVLPYLAGAKPIRIDPHTSSTQDVPLTVTKPQ